MKKMIALVVLVAASILLPVTVANANTPTGSFTVYPDRIVIDWGQPQPTVDVNVRINGQTYNYHPNTGDDDGKLTLVFADLGWPTGVVEWAQVHDFNCHVGEPGSPGFGTVCKTGDNPPADPPVDPESPVEVCWLLPQPGTPDDVTWPQAYVPDCVPPCESTLQIDTYPSQEAADALTADGVLELGEDYGVAQSWRFVTGDVCEPVVEYGKWSYGKPVCGFDTVTDTREVYTTVILPGGERGETTTKVEAVVRPITDVEKAALGLCGKLALTGSNDGWLIGSGVALLTLGAIFLAVRFKPWHVFRKPAGLHKAVK
mgnify:CR=1 FL=1